MSAIAAGSNAASLAWLGRIVRHRRPSPALCGRAPATKSLRTGSGRIGSGPDPASSLVGGITGPRFLDLPHRLDEFTSTPPCAHHLGGGLHRHRLVEPENTR